MPKPVVFDEPIQTDMRKAKTDFLRREIPPLQASLGLHTAFDIGCGVGYFSAMLRDMGFQVVAVDGREENIGEARDRHPGIDFRVADAEDPSLPAIGKFDLVLCVGLLYHLENPLRAFRNLHAMTGKLLIVESMAIPSDKPFFVLLDEGPLADESLRALSCYPSEGAIIKMAYRAGFPHVYRFRELPDQEDFRRSFGRDRARTMVAASTTRLDTPLLEIAEEPRLSGDLWNTDPTGIARKLRKIRQKRKIKSERKRT